MSPAATAGSGFHCASAEHHRADLRVRERLEDGLHAGHLTPHVESAAVGVAHDELAAAAGVALRRAPALHRLVDRGLVEVLVRAGDRGQDDVGHLRRPVPSPSRPTPDRRRCSRRTPPTDRSPVAPVAAGRAAAGGRRSVPRRLRHRCHTPLPPAPTRATRPMILIRCMFLPPCVGARWPSRIGSFRHDPCLLPQRVPSPRPSMDGRRSERSGRLPFSEDLLHRPDDPVARDQHAADDDEPEHDELQRGGQAHDPHHLAEPGQEERRGPRRQRAGQPPGERGPADDHGGDRAEQVRRPDRDAEGAQERRQQDPGHAVQDRRHHVRRDLVQVDPQAGDPRRRRGSPRRPGTCGRAS